ncbi:hypothetical protein [Algoriphagus sp.]|uniref:hypothetical protein n=1 Tax=Algoriphagus sp. TaxID=1872435 RepID=UPI00391C87E8
MPYITKSNYRKILRKIDISQIGEISGTVYKKPIYFLSRNEEKYLLLMQALLKEPEKFLIEYYKPVISKDTLTYVFESKQPPSFHLDKNCDKLNSSFRNFVVPFEIKERAFEKGGEDLVEEQVKKFRAWFQSNLELFQTDPNSFLKKLDIDWNVQRKMDEIEVQNSGIKEVENLNLEELEKEIDKIIGQAGYFFVSNPDKQSIIRRFQKLTFLANSEKEIYNNDTGWTDIELKNFLKMYDERYKKPTKKLLLEYYRVLYNPDLSFEGSLLEQLNFKKCSVCENPSLPMDFLMDAPEENENEDYLIF